MIEGAIANAGKTHRQARGNSQEDLYPRVELSQAAFDKALAECKASGDWQTIVNEPAMTPRQLLQCMSPLLAQSGHWRLKIAAVQTRPEPHFADRKTLM